MRGAALSVGLALLAWGLGFDPTAGAPAWAATSGKLEGRRLVDVLEELRQQGLNLIYSSAAVDRDLVVTREPTSAEPRSVLDEILPPVGLEALDGPGGAVLIVQRVPLGRLKGRVVSSATGRPIVRATIRILGTTLTTDSRPDGSFGLPPLPQGDYDVRVDATGFLGRTLAGLRVATGATEEVFVALAAQPRFVEEILVTPSRHAIVADEPAARTIYQDDALLVPVIGRDVSRVIELLPGLTAPDNSTAFNVRGSAARDVSLVLDGLELYEPFHLESFQSPFSFIDSAIVERIDFLGGGFTANLGDRHGGFVEISTTAPQEPRQSGIEIGTLNSRVTHGQSFRSGSLLISARAWYPQALNDTIQFGEAGFNPRFADAYVKVSITSSPTTAVSAHALLARDVVKFRETGDGNETVDSRNGSDQAWLRIVRSWSPSVVSETVLSAGRFRKSRRGLSEPDTGPVVVVDDRAVDFYGLKQDFTWRTSDANALKGGFEVRPLEAEYSYESGPSGGTVPLRFDPSGTSSAAYVANRHSFSEHFATELGLRWDRQTYTNERQLSPRLNATWRPSERSELRLGVGRFFQSQRIHELHVEDRETRFQPAELSRQAELTFVQRLGGDLAFRLDGYVRRLTHVQPRWENLFNPVELFPETEADRVLVSPERADLRGIELLLQGAPGRPLQWWASYAWSAAEDVIDEHRVPRSWDQTHAGKFLLAYRFSRGWSASLAGTLHTGWPTTPVSGEVVTLPDGSTEIEPVVGARNSDRFASYARFDARVSRALDVPRGRLRFDLDVLNLANRKNACCVADFVFTLRPDGSVQTTRELESWLGITPSFSVLWEF